MINNVVLFQRYIHYLLLPFIQFMFPKIYMGLNLCTFAEANYVKHFMLPFLHAIYPMYFRLLLRYEESLRRIVSIILLHLQRL